MTRSEEISACEAAIELGMELSNLYALLRAQRLRGGGVEIAGRRGRSHVRRGKALTHASDPATARAGPLDRRSEGGPPRALGSVAALRFAP